MVTTVTMMLVKMKRTNTIKKLMTKRKGIKECTIESDAETDDDQDTKSGQMQFLCEATGSDHWLSIVNIVEEGQSIYYKEAFYFHKMQCVSNSLHQENLMVPRQSTESK